MFKALIVLSLLIVYTANGQVITTLNENYHNKVPFTRSNGSISLYHVTLFSGAALAIVGGYLFLDELGNSTEEYNAKRSKTGETLFYIGGGLLLISIPLMIDARNSSFGFGASKIPVIKGADADWRLQPLLRFTISLDRKSSNRYVTGSAAR